MRKVSFLALAVGAVLAVHSCGDGGVAPPTPPVAPPNRPPVAAAAIAAAEVAVGATLAVDVSSGFSDPDGDALSYAASSSNALVASVAVAGSSVTVTAVARGDVVITVTARDPGGLTAQQTFAVRVPNRAPVATAAIPEAELAAWDTLVVDASAHFTDPDGDELTWEAASSSASVASVGVSGSVVTVAAVGEGSAVVTVTARDPDGLSAQQSVAVRVVSPSGYLHLHIQQEEADLGAIVLEVSGAAFDSLRAAPALTIYDVPSPEGIRVFLAGPVPLDGPLFSFWVEDLGSVGRYGAALLQAAAKTYERRDPDRVVLTLRP